jgi:tyrosyl-DNA phosphodiesterase-1
MDRPTKRVKITTETASRARGGARLNHLGNLRSPSSLSQSGRGNPLKSLSRSITPPPAAARSRAQQPSRHPQKASPISSLPINQYEGNEDHGPRLQVVSSPVKLTHIRDMPSASGNNTDAIKLKDILGDPMIRECWQFNYLFDVDFLMSQFDEDVRTLVRVKIVHGSWKKEAPNRIQVDVSANRNHTEAGSFLWLLLWMCSQSHSVDTHHLCTVGKKERIILRICCNCCFNGCIG